jgi:prepilin-type N-terminal cleavage/methylation domain-containing protein
MENDKRRVTGDVKTRPAMESCHPSHVMHDAFTLIELLVVIAILAVPESR